MQVVRMDHVGAEARRSHMLMEEAMRLLSYMSAAGLVRADTDREREEYRALSAEGYADSYGDQWRISQAGRDVIAAAGVAWSKRDLTGR